MLPGAVRGGFRMASVGVRGQGKRRFMILESVLL